LSAIAQTLARHSDIRLTLGRYAHVGLHDVAAAVDSMTGLVPADYLKEAVAPTGTDGTVETGQNPLGPFLGPRSGKSVQEAGQSGTEEANPPKGATHDDAVVLAGFSGEETERPLPDSNRGWRICNPQPCKAATSSHSVTSVDSEQGRGERLDRALTQENAPAREINPDLALIIDAWPQLPEAIRRAIMALIMIHPDLVQQNAKQTSTTIGASSKQTR